MDSAVMKFAPLAGIETNTHYAIYEFKKMKFAPLAGIETFT